jgi:hypothetical protein
MLKKITLIGIFAAVSVVSFGTSTPLTNAARASNKVPSVTAPVMKGFGACMSYNCR